MITSQLNDGYSINVRTSILKPMHDFTFSFIMPWFEHRNPNYDWLAAIDLKHNREHGREEEEIGCKKKVYFQ